MFKSKTFIGLSIVLCVIFSSCEFFNTSVPDWFKEYTDYPSVSDTSWAGKGKKDSSCVINAAASEDFTVTLRLNNAQHFKFTAGENMTLTLPQPLKDAGLNISAVKIKQDESDLSKIIITYPADFLRAAEIKGGSNKFDISPEVILKHPKIGIDFCTYNSLKIICNSAPARPSGSVLYKDTSDSKYVICFNMPDKNAMKTGAQDSDIKSIQINGTDYPITISADGTFDFNPPNPNFKQGVSPSSADSNYQQVDSSSPAFIKNGQPVYFKTDDAVGSHPVYKIEVFDKTIGSGAVTVSADMLRLKNPSVQQKDSFGTFTNLASGVNNIPVSDDGSTASVYITPPSEYEGGSPVQDVSVIYELWRGHDTASDRILSGTVEAAHTVVSVPGGKTLLRVYAHKDGAMDSAVTEYKISVDAYVYYVKGEGASELSGIAVDTNEGTKFYPFATVKAAIQRINDEGSSTTPYTVYVDGSAQETAAISVGGNGGGTTARKVQIKRYGSGTAGFGRKDEHTPSGTLLTVEKDSELTLNGITLDGKNIALAADEIVTRGNTVFEGCTVQNYTAETKRVLYVENGNCTISNTVMQGAASLTTQGYVYVNKTAAESPVFTVKGSVKIGGAGDLTSVILGCYEDSPHNWNSTFVNADGLNAGSYINLVPSKYDKQSGKTLVKGSGASSYKDYFHIAGNSDVGGHYLLEAGDDGGINNALILKKSIIINGGDENAWAKLKYNAERANDGEVIVVTGTIKASNSTATINSTSVNNFGDIVITKKVTIRAKDETGAIIDANKKDGGKTAHRIFKADGAGAELTLQNIKLQGGIAEGTSESGYGGALYVKGGAALVLDKCVVTDNSASAGGGIYLSATSKLKTGSSRIVPSADKAAGKNDVYLAKDTYIELTDISGSGVIAQISPELRLSGIKIAEYTGITSAPSNIASRFAVTSTADGIWILKYNVSSKEFNLYQTAVYGDGNDIAWAQLRAAAANSATGDVITAKGIIKASNTQLQGTTENNYGEISVTKKITVKGEAGAVIDANKDGLGGAAHRIFNISESGAELNLQSINLKNGKSTSSGGAISVSGGAKLNLSAGVSITDCSAAFGGAVYASGNGTKVVIDGAHLKADTASLEGSAIHLSDSAFAEVKGEAIIHGNHVAGGTSPSPSPSSVYLKGGARFTLGGKAKISNESGKNGSGVFINGAEFTMSGNAEISGNSTTSSGGGVHIEGTGGKFNMTGGTVSGNTAVSGGGVYIASGCEFNMSGGIVKDNKAVDTSSTQCKGGGVFLAGKFNMSGGIISGNEAKKSDTEYGDGGGVYTESSGAELKMSGGARIVPSADKKSGKNDVYINADKLIYITGELTGTEKVACITPKTYLAGTELVKWMGSGNMPSGYAGRFDLTSNGGIWELLLKSDNKTFILNQPSAVIDGDNGGTWAQLKTAVETAVDNKEIIIKGTIKAAYGNEEIKVSKQITIKPQSGTPIIDADKANQGAKVHRIFRVVSGASLTLKNIDLRNGKAATGGISDVSGTSTRGGAIYVESGATLTMENGRIGDCTAAGYGGAIANLGTLNLSGVSFESNEALADSGGAIYNDGSGSIQAVGCKFGGDSDASGNKAHKDGGAIAVNGSSAGEIKIKDGKISHNEAKNGKGGGIYSGSAITIEGTNSSRSEISSNKAKENGGGIYTSARLDITYLNNNDNTANGNGGGICAESTLTMESCTVNGNTAADDDGVGGGGIYATGTLTMQGCTISGNYAKKDGGGIYAVGELALTDCTVTANESQNNGYGSTSGSGSGGGIYIKSRCTMTGGSVTGNKANSNGNGGGIYIDGNGSFTMTGGTVSNNTTEYGDGGGIYVAGTGGFTLEGGSLTGNEATQNKTGGGVYVKDGTFTIKGAACVTPSTDNVEGKNDVYLDNGKMITVDGVLSPAGGIAARITVAYIKYLPTTQVLAGTAALLNSEHSKFAVTPQAVGSEKRMWRINGQGYLQKPPVEIKGTDSLAWKKLKDAVQAADNGDVISIIGEIKATNDTDNSGELEIKKNITIQGKKTDRTDTLNANKDDFGTAPFRIFKVEAGKKLTLENLTLKNGKNNETDLGGSPNPKGKGGAIYSKGELEIRNVLITGCEARYSGGGIYCSMSGSRPADERKLVIENTEVTSCKAPEPTYGTGGGVYIVGENCRMNVKLSDVKIKNNEASSSAAGLCLHGSHGAKTTADSVVLTRVTLHENKLTDTGARGGAGMVFATYDRDSAITLKNCTVTKNESETFGGGISLHNSSGGLVCGKLILEDSSVTENKAQNGGGIYVNLSNLVMKNTDLTSNLTSNTATMEGGGIFAKGGSVELNSCTIKGNTGTLAGGGICARANGSTPARVTINGGVIGGTSASEANTTGSSGKGGGIFVSGANSEVTLLGTANVIGNTATLYGGGVFVDTDCVLNMQGSAIVTPSTGSDANAPLKNDVYLMNGCKIKLSETLSGAVPVARITPATYNTTTQVLTGGAVGTEHGKFTVTPKDLGSGNTQQWEINSTGFLQKVPITILGMESDAWTKLKTEVEKTGGGAAKITIQGTILATPAHKGEITVSREVEIEGNGTDAVLNADVNNRIFKVNTAGKLTIKNLKLTGGLSNGAALQSENYGGAIYNEGELTVISCEMRDNFAEHSGGGAIYVKHGGKCTIKGTGARKTIIAKNEASKGGGIQIDGECTVDEYTVIGGSAGDANKGKQFAGGILVGSTGKCTIKGGVEISYNTLTETSGTKGGGIYVEESSGNKGELILEGSAGKTVTIKENKATKGAGIFCEGKVVSMKYTEIKNCIAARNGGGVYVDSAACTFEMTGSAKVTVSTGVDKNKEGMNEIFLKDGVIKVTGTLTAGDGQAGRISVMSSKYETSTEVLTGDNLPTNSGKFRVTKQKIPNQAWKVSPSGKLQKN
ncbi:MAG: hypothetical protein ACTTHU_05525 [Treponema sp.]